MSITLTDYSRRYFEQELLYTHWSVSQLRAATSTCMAPIELADAMLYHSIHAHHPVPVEATSGFIGCSEVVRCSGLGRWRSRPLPHRGIVLWGARLVGKEKEVLSEHGERVPLIDRLPSISPTESMRCISHRSFSLSLVHHCDPGKKINKFGDVAAYSARIFSCCGLLQGGPHHTDGVEAIPTSVPSHPMSYNLNLD